MDEQSLPFGEATPEAAISTARPRKRPHRHVWAVGRSTYLGEPVDEWHEACTICFKAKDPAASRRGKNNRKRGTSAELDVARALGGRKMGPLGLPWDVEMEGYARLQVKKNAKWPSLNEVVGYLNAIPTGEAMPGAVLIEAAGQGVRGEALIVFRLRDFAERHGR